MVIPLVVIAGPTGVGKTKVAIEIAERIGGEIVGADSRQIYRYMDIGTAKPTLEERVRVPHHLIDIRNPNEEYSAAEYAKDASAAIHEIHIRGKIPLLVGGTGLYIQAVLSGMFEGPGRDEVFRAQMRSFVNAYGSTCLHKELCRVDPKTAQRVHSNDLMRIIRALEVHHLTGKPISEYQASATEPLALYHSCFLVLSIERRALYARINARVDQMISQGLIEEVQGLIKRGYHADLNSMNSVGYKEIMEFLFGIRDLPSAVELIKRNTRRYAKRQLTWFRKYQSSFWIDCEESETFEDVVEKCLRIISRWKEQNP
jgi:tRNA dimethylallyltransferase